MSEDETPPVINRAQKLCSVYGNGQEAICTGYPCNVIQKLALMIAESEERVLKLEKDLDVARARGRF